LQVFLKFQLWICNFQHNMRGAVSMANNGPDTNASQFFITYDKQPHLDLKYTLFAKLVVYISYQHSKLC